MLLLAPNTTAVRCSPTPRTSQPASCSPHPPTPKVPPKLLPAPPTPSTVLEQSSSSLPPPSYPKTLEQSSSSLPPPSYPKTFFRSSLNPPQTNRVYGLQKNVTRMPQREESTCTVHVTAVALRSCKRRHRAVLHGRGGFTRDPGPYTCKSLDKIQLNGWANATGACAEV